MNKSIIYIIAFILAVAASIALGADEEITGGTPRFFVLDYRLNRYTGEVKQSTAHVFNHVLTAGDRLLVLAGDRTLLFERVSDKIKTFGLVESVLRQQSAWTRQLMQTELKSMAEFITWVRKQAKEDVHPGATYGDWKGVHPHYYMKYLKNSIERYLDMLTGYKEKFLLPDIIKYYRLFNRLQAIEGEKRYIAFYQEPALPGYARENREMIDEWVKELSIRGLLDEQDYVKKLSRLQDNIDDLFEVSSRQYDLLFMEMTHQFQKGGFTFHTVFLSPDKQLLEHGVTMKADIREALKERMGAVARMTGGQLYTVETLKTSQLVLPPSVRTNKPQKHPPSAYLAKKMERIAKTENAQADIRIEDISFKRKTLSMVISGFARAGAKKPSGSLKGKLNVLVRIIDNEGKVVFDKKKALLAQKKSIALSLDFKWLKPGNYWLITDAKDLITGKAWAHVTRFELH